MAERNFRELLEARWEKHNFLSVALDPDFEKIPEHVRQLGAWEALVVFNRAIVEATKEFVCAFKVNPAFYEAHGDEGWSALRQTVQYIHENAPDLPVILDGKRADIGNSNNGYIASAFDYLRADAITVHPYLGSDALQPFLDRKEKGVIVLCRTSNTGAGEFQDLKVGTEPLYMHVARHVKETWNANGNCALVVGATYPEEMRVLRTVADDLPFLIPGVGAQGGDIEKTVRAGRDSRGAGMVITVARAILFASKGKDFAEAARAEAQRLDGAIRKAL
jgi:orotidine-5'-phosphate decarboxylase